MVTGVDRFRAHFAGHEHQYVLIGGAACELIMNEVGLDFRATKDLDIVLIVEGAGRCLRGALLGLCRAGRVRDQGAKPGRESPLPFPEAEG
ncbi:hypothetical protein [Mesorhizobium amorphae]|uniref:hypothetical protein n=1 Tax=Mesorhizobium amorphae TaxID=71433 RepID=UPI000B10B6CE|nr:hypothetical protein [Mesorhizobium amorphae]